MKKLFYVLLVCSTAFAGCQKAEIITSENHSTEPALTSVQDSYRYNEGSIVLGKQIEIPYSVSNLKKALELVSPETRSAINEDDIVPTHYYVKFSPENEAELSILKNDPKLILSEYPLDREILVDGCSYHDPSLPADMPTYQYSTIEASYWKARSDTLSVRSEVLIEAFMPDYYDDDVETKAGQGIELSALENLMETAYKMTGHEYMPETKADMKIVWESDRWDIRDGNTVQAYFNGPKIYGQPWNVDIYNGDLKALRYAAIHRAAFRHYFGNNCGLTRPGNTRKEKISYFHDSRDYMGRYLTQMGSTGVWSDIQISGIDTDGSFFSPSIIFSTTCHELGHCAHYLANPPTFALTSALIRESWATCVEYVLTRQEYLEFALIYPDLNVMDKFQPKDTINNVVYEIPNSEYNFQSVKITKNVDYSPLFIDFIDDCNQFQYYKAVNPGNESYYLTVYPDDRVSGVPVNVLENIVFSTLGRRKIRDAIVDFANTAPDFNYKTYGLNEENINMIFALYI